MKIIVLIAITGLLTAAGNAKTLPSPVPAVLTHYSKIETALASDKLDGVADAANAIAKLVTDDSKKTLPATIATEAAALGKAKDIKDAREEFKKLSASLIDYLAKEKAETGQYFEMYCGMAQASWLQTDKAVKNPYYGASMLKCGELKKTY
jgi:hypothetical protein